MAEWVEGSSFLKRTGGSFGSLNYYAVDTGGITDEQIYVWLVECGAWLPMVDEGNPVTDMNAAMALAIRQDILDGDALYWSEGREAWCVGYPEYGGGMDPLAIAKTPQRAICLYLLRYPEIDRLVNDKHLPYAGWVNRYKED